MHKGTRVRKQRYISIYISLYMKIFLKTGVYIYYISPELPTFLVVSNLKGRCSFPDHKSQINACYHVWMKQPVFILLIYFSMELKTGNSKSRSLICSGGKGKLAGSHSTNRRVQERMIFSWRGLLLRWLLLIVTNFWFQFYRSITLWHSFL